MKTTSGKIVFRLLWKLLGVATIIPALDGLHCAISFVAPRALYGYPDPLDTWSVRIMAAVSLVLTLWLLLVGVYLVAARHPRFLALGISYGGVWFIHGLTLIVPDLLPESVRISVGGAEGVADTTIRPLQLWHIPIIGAVLCLTMVFLSAKRRAAAAATTTPD
jgi:hypothetical protein